MATVHEDGTVTLQLPADVTAGPHRIVAIIEEASTEQISPNTGEFVFTVIDDAEWTGDDSLRREDVYGDDGR